MTSRYVLLLCLAAGCTSRATNSTWCGQEVCAAQPVILDMTPTAADLGGAPAPDLMPSPITVDGPDLSNAPALDMMVVAPPDFSIVADLLPTPQDLSPPPPDLTAPVYSCDTAPYPSQGQVPVLMHEADIFPDPLTSKWQHIQMSIIGAGPGLKVHWVIGYPPPLQNLSGSCSITPDGQLTMFSFFYDPDGSIGGYFVGSKCFACPVVSPIPGACAREVPCVEFYIPELTSP